MMTIYEELGDERLHELVENFYDKVVADDRINHLFPKGIDEVKRKQYLFLSQFLGGPPRYTNEFGHPKMRLRHMPHKITQHSAIAWLENMKAAIEMLDMPQEFKDRLFMRFPHVASHMVNS